MSLFEYIMILMSIVLGFGITSNLRAISRLKLEDMKLDSYIILGYYLTIILLQLDFWTAIWGLSNRTTWSLLDISIWLFPILVLFLAGAYLDRSGSEDPAEVRFTRKAALISMLGWTVGAFITINTFSTLPLINPISLSVVVFIVFLALGLFDSRPKFQLASSIGSLLFSIYFLFVIGDNQLIDPSLVGEVGVN